MQFETVNITVPNVSPTTVVVMSINGWIIFQQRIIPDSVNFNVPWSDYKNGFGSPDSSFWLGLERIYQLISNGKYKLRIEMQVLNGSAWFSVEYDDFYIESEGAGYRIHVSVGGNGNTTSSGAGFSGDINDVMNSKNIQNQVHNGMQFSTYDRDDDFYLGNCASIAKGGWWYNICSSFFNLNGYYGNQFFFRNGGNMQPLSASRMLMKLIWYCSHVLMFELSTGHFFWTRPDPAKRWPDPTRECRQKVWPRPDPTHGPTFLHMYTFFNWIIIY